jgi:5'-3' exonuclease, C-terminal SAM fold
MIPLIDSDILLHEIGWSSQFKDKETGEEILFDFERTAEMLDEKIRLICEDVGATGPPILFISDSEWISNKLGREYVPGFRYSIAKTKPYKGTRHNPKPFHFYNILVYLMANYHVVVSKDGYEADDEICMHQQEMRGVGIDTIICSRDKDLRICPGAHFSWECGKQRAIGPHTTDTVGSLHKKENGEVYGYGLKFFYYQMLVGDSADNIPGLPKVGTVGAYNLLNNLNSVEDLHKTVKNAYMETMGESAKDYFLEQSSLLWMVHVRGQSFLEYLKEIQ